MESKEHKYGDNSDHSEIKKRKEENESQEYNFDKTEDSQLFRNFQNNWDDTFAKVYQEPTCGTVDSKNLWDWTQAVKNPPNSQKSTAWKAETL